MARGNSAKTSVEEYKCLTEDKQSNFPPEVNDGAGILFVYLESGKHHWVTQIIANREKMATLEPAK